MLEAGNKVDRQPPQEDLGSLLSEARSHFESTSKDEAIDLQARAEVLERDISKLVEDPAIEDLARILSRDDLIVICSKPFSNNGYPRSGNCQLAVSKHGLGIGYWTMSGQVHPNSVILTGRLDLGDVVNPHNYDRDCTFWIKSDFKWNPFSKWFGARSFDFKNAAEAGITSESVEKSLRIAANNIRQEKAVIDVPLRA